MSVYTKYRAVNDRNKNKGDVQNENVSVGPSNRRGEVDGPLLAVSDRSNRFFVPFLRALCLMFAAMYWLSIFLRLVQCLHHTAHLYSCLLPQIFTCSMASSVPQASPPLGVSIIGYEEALKRELGRIATGECSLSISLTSPRSLAACRAIGLTVEDLRPLSRQEYDASNPVVHSLLQKHPPSSPRAASPSSEQSERPASSSALPSEVYEKVYAHYKARLLEKVHMVKEQRRQMISKSQGEDGFNFLLRDEYEVGRLAKGVSLSQANGAGIVNSTSDVTTLDHVRNNDKPLEDVEERAKYLKSAMMEMEERRMEAVKKRQEKEFVRLLEGEKRSVLQQQKLMAAAEEELRKKKEHEKAVMQHRKAEIERKLERDSEMQLQAEEDQRRRRELARKEAAMKAKLAAEAREAERIRRQEAVAREEERQAKLESLRQRTEGILEEQRRRGEEQRREIEAREERVKAQVMSKKEAKAAEIQAAHAEAKKRIHNALLRNQAIQYAKREAYQERTAEAARRAEEQHAKRVEAAAQAIEARKLKQAKADERYAEASRRLDEKIRTTLSRAEERAHFYAKVAAEREQAALLLRVEKELRKHDKLENVERIKRKEAYDKASLLAKEEADTARYELIKREKAYLQEQRKLTSQEAMIRKHQLKKAMENMRVTNKFWVAGIDEIEKKGPKKSDVLRTMSSMGNKGRTEGGTESGREGGRGKRPGSA